MSTDTPVTPALETTSSSTDRFMGRVKWFNTKTGYGFITVTDGDKSGSDIFVHHSAVIVSSEQYKYLVQGEYVEFTISHTEGGTHEYQAGDVSGIKGGKLMCETRKEFRDTRTSYNADEDDVMEQAPRSVRPPQERRNQPERRPQQDRRPEREVRSRNDQSADQGEAWSYIAGKKRDARPSGGGGRASGGRGSSDRGSGGRGSGGRGRDQGNSRDGPGPRLEL